MTSIRRGSGHARAVVGVHLDPPSQRTSPATTIELVASWLVSGRALRASRPDLHVGERATEVELSWHLRLQSSPTWRILDARAALDLGSGSSPVELLTVDPAEPGCRVHRDHQHDVTSIRLSVSNRELLLLVAGGDIMSTAAKSTVAAPLVYARTSLLNDAAPLGLAVGGGRYEFSGSTSRPVIGG